MLNVYKVRKNIKFIIGIRRDRDSNRGPYNSAATVLHQNYSSNKKPYRKNHSNIFTRQCDYSMTYRKKYHRKERHSRLSYFYCRKVSHNVRPYYVFLCHQQASPSIDLLKNIINPCIHKKTQSALHARIPVKYLFQETLA